MLIWCQRRVRAQLHDVLQKKKFESFFRNEILQFLPVSALQSDPCRKFKILLKGAGFEVTDEEVMNQHYCSNETYYDHEIFLKNQRAWFMDSVLSSATDEERAAAKVC